MIEISRFNKSTIHDEFLKSRNISHLPFPDAGLLGLDRVTHLSLQFPGEHCTECSAPECHDSCDLFEKGMTGRCRRFADGLIARKCETSPFSYYLEAIFKPASMLLCVGNTYCLSKVSYRRMASICLILGRISYFIQTLFRKLPSRAQWCVTDKIRGMGNRLPRLLNRLAARKHKVRPGSLLCIAGNPGKEPIAVEVTVSGFGNSQDGRSFRAAKEICHGWHAIRIPVEEIISVIDLKKLFRVSIVPVIDQPAILQFLYIGFIREMAAGGQSDKKIKLVVLDLDNTIWSEILVESNGADPELCPGVRETIEELDRRGILLSIASKNNHDDAKRVLENKGIWDLFLSPRIRWGPKSVSIREIISELNIGPDAVAFVDDSEFELAEVKTALPEVRTYNASVLSSLLTLPAFDVPVTEESRNRRLLYKSEAKRKREFSQTRVDYDQFLESCGMKLFLMPFSKSNRQRVLELIQRTNQLNFSGNRYTSESLDQIPGENGMMPVVMRCEDKFGDYGIIGFAILNTAGTILEIADLMFSCRVQGKKVEHGFISYLISIAGECGFTECVCKFRRTERNEPAAKVFDDMLFVKKRETCVEEYSIAVEQFKAAKYPVKVVDEMNVPAKLLSVNA